MSDDFCFYLEHPAVTALAPHEVDAWRAAHKVAVESHHHAVPKPARSFIESAFPEFITSAIETMGFAAPTAIQPITPAQLAGVVEAQAWVGP